VANRTDYRLGSFKKLWAMTTNTRVMTGIIGNVGKVPHFFPVVSGNLVAGIARSLMFPGGV
jgi:hypothetical protein